MRGGPDLPLLWTAQEKAVGIVASNTASGLPNPSTDRHRTSSFSSAPIFADFYRFSWRRKESRRTRPFRAQAAEPGVRIHLAPPTSPSPIRIGPEIIKIRAPAAYFARLVAAEVATNLANRPSRPILSLF